MTMHQCYYCGKEVSKFSKEHVLPSFLGCGQTVNNYMCIECNSKFGQGIDADFASQFNWIRVLFALKDARGKLPPPLFKLECEDGNYYDLLPGGKPILSRPEFDQSSQPEGTKVRAKYRTWDEAKKHLPKLMTKAKDGLDIERGHEYINKLKINFSCGGDDVFRSFGKSILSLIALRRNDLLQNTNVIKLKDYVLDGKGEPRDWFQHDLISSSSLLSPIGIMDNVLAVSFEKGENIIKACLQVFGELRFVCEIPLSLDMNDSFNLALTNDPFSRKMEITEPVGLLIKSLSECKKQWESDMRFNRMQEKVLRLGTLHAKMSSEIKIKEIIETSLNRAFGDPNDEPITKEQLDTLISSVAESFVMWTNRISESQKIKIQNGENLDSFVFK